MKVPETTVPSRLAVIFLMGLVGLGLAISPAVAAYITSPTDIVSSSFLPGLEGTASAGSVRYDLSCFCYVPIDVPVDRVTVSIRRARDGNYWTGVAWAPTANPIELDVQYDRQTFFWNYTGNLPSGSSLPDGRYVFSAYEYDGSFKSTTPYTTTVDSTRPVVDFTSPTNGQTLSSSDYTISGLATDGDGSGIDHVDLYIRRNSDLKYWTSAGWGNATPLSTGVGGGGWSNSAALPTGADVTEGAYLLLVYAYDRAGHGSSTLISVTFDKTPPPAPAISSPANGSTVPALFSVEGTAVDNPGGSGIASVDFTLQRLSDGQFWDASGSNWTFTPMFLPTELSGNNWKLACCLPSGFLLQNGTYRIVAIARDLSGYSNNVSSTFTVNKINPGFSFTIPVDNGTYSAFPYPLSGTVSAAPGLSVSRVDLWLYWPTMDATWDGTNWGPHVVTTLSTTLAANGTNWYLFGNYPTAGVDAPDDTYVAWGWAYDNGGNFTTLLYTFTLDNTRPPPASFNFPTNSGAVQNFSLIGGGAADNPGGSGIDHVALLIIRNSDGAYWTTNNDWGGLFQGFLTTSRSDTNWSRSSGLPSGVDLSEGSYTLESVAYDRAGNYSVLTVITNVVDQTSPTLAFATPQNNAHAFNFSYFEGTAADNVGGGGLDRVDLTIQRSSDGYYWAGTNWTAASTPLATTLSGTWLRNTGLPSATNLLGTNYTCTVTAYDLAGNSSRALINVTIDKNDDFAGRLVLRGSTVNVFGSNLGATKEPGELNHAGNVGGDSVWWSWTAPSSGGVTITTSGSDFDTLLAVYTGSSVANLTVIASNDDDPYGDPGTRFSRVIFNAEAGRTYQIAVDGYAGSSGNIQLNLTRPVLGLGQSATNVLIVWPASEIGFGLETAASLSATSVWTTVATPPTAVGNLLVLTNALGRSNQFYRLRKP